MVMTLEQQRAAYAWQRAEPGFDQAGSDYVNLSKSAPSMVMSSGLMQTLAFLKDKDGSAHRLVLEDVSRWLCKRFDGEPTSNERFPFPREGEAEFRKLMQALFHSTPQQYQRATSEVMSILRWLRHLAATFKGGR